MIDLAEEWRRLDARRRKPDAKAHWDKRAETYSFKDAPDEYLRVFITKAGIAGGERVLDMGCGTGSLSLALAGMGCSVIAADFSEGMLSRVRENAVSRGMLFEEAGFPWAFQIVRDGECIPAKTMQSPQGSRDSLPLLRRARCFPCA